MPLRANANIVSMLENTAKLKANLRKQRMTLWEDLI